VSRSGVCEAAPAGAGVFVVAARSARRDDVPRWSLGAARSARSDDVPGWSLGAARSARSDDVPGWSLGAARSARSADLPRTWAAARRVVSRCLQRMLAASLVSRVTRFISSSSEASRSRERFRAASGRVQFRWISARRTCMRSRRAKWAWVSSDSKKSRMVSIGMSRSWAMSCGSASGSRSKEEIERRRDGETKWGLTSGVFVVAGADGVGAGATRCGGEGATPLGVWGWSSVSMVVPPSVDGLHEGGLKKSGPLQVRRGRRLCAQIASLNGRQRVCGLRRAKYFAQMATCARGV